MYSLMNFEGFDRFQSVASLETVTCLKQRKRSGIYLFNNNCVYEDFGEDHADVQKVSAILLLVFSLSY